MTRPSQGVLGAPLIYVYAALVGCLGAGAALGFQELVDLLQELVTRREGSILEVARALPWWQRLAVPTAGGLVAALIVRAFVRRSTPFGVSDLMEVVSLRKQRIHPLATLARCGSSAAVIATGGSVGREGPIIQLGAMLSARVSALVHLGPRRHAILLGCGVSAGMAATYNAPLAGAFFVMEVILGNFAMEVVAPVVLSSVVAALVVREAHGDSALYDIPPELHLVGVLPFVAALVLGIPGGALGVGFQRLLEGVGRRIGELRLPAEAKAGLGGLAIGVIGLEFPEVWGNGYDAANELLAGALPLATVALLLLVKPIATAITVGSGGSGGVFTPTLFVGAAWGMLFGMGFNRLFPLLAVPAPAFAVMGMAALLAGTTHAPIMSMMLLFEMTQEQKLLPPLMLAVLSSTVVARLLSRDSIYTRKLRERGVPVDAGLEELTLRKTLVRDILRADHERVPEETTLDEILRRFQAARRDVVYVVREGRELAGRIVLHDVKPFLNQPELGPVVTATDVMGPIESIDPDASIAEVIDRFDEPDVEELPVTKVHAGRPILVGRLTRRDLIACLNLEVLKRESMRAKVLVGENRPNYVELPKGYRLARLPIPEALVGRTIAKSGLREDENLSILTLIERDERGVEHRKVPDPDLELKRGQFLVVLGEYDAIQAFRKKAGL